MTLLVTEWSPPHAIKGHNLSIQFTKSSNSRKHGLCNLTPWIPFAYRALYNFTCFAKQTICKLSLKQCLTSSEFQGCDCSARFSAILQLLIKHWSLGRRKSPLPRPLLLDCLAQTQCTACLKDTAEELLHFKHEMLKRMWAQSWKQLTKVKACWVLYASTPNIVSSNYWVERGGQDYNNTIAS